MKTKPSSVAEYLAALPDDRRATLEKLRETVLAVAPRVEEGISYGIPVFTLDGRPLVWVAAWKQHYSLYPIGETMLRAVAGDAADYSTSKGTVKLPASQPVPYALVKRLVKARLAELKENGR